MGRGILLWLLGVPIPIIILLALIWHLSCRSLHRPARRPAGGQTGRTPDHRWRGSEFHAAAGAHIARFIGADIPGRGRIRRFAQKPLWSCGGRSGGR
jgi:hypothetical protein